MINPNGYIVLYFTCTEISVPSVAINRVYFSFLEMFFQLVQVSTPGSSVELGHSGVRGVQSVGGDGVGGVIKVEV